MRGSVERDAFVSAHARWRLRGRVRTLAFVRAATEMKDKGTFTYATEAIAHADVRRFMEKTER